MRKSPKKKGMLLYNPQNKDDYMEITPAGDHIYVIVLNGNEEQREITPKMGEFSKSLHIKAIGRTLKILCINTPRTDDTEYSVDNESIIIPLLYKPNQRINTDKQSYIFREQHIYLTDIGKLSKRDTTVLPDTDARAVKLLVLKTLDSVEILGVTKILQSYFKWINPKKDFQYMVVNNNNNTKVWNPKRSKWEDLYRFNKDYIFNRL